MKSNAIANKGVFFLTVIASAALVGCSSSDSNLGDTGAGRGGRGGQQVGSGGTGTGGGTGGGTNGTGGSSAAGASSGGAGGSSAGGASSGGAGGRIGTGGANGAAGAGGTAVCSATQLCTAANAFCEIAQPGCLTSGASGVCTRKPQACLDIYLPVCGCDGHTYGNDCARQSAGIQLAHDGAC